MAREPGPGPRVRGSLHSHALRRHWGGEAESRQGSPERQELGWSLERRGDRPQAIPVPCFPPCLRAVGFSMCRNRQKRKNITVYQSLNYYFFFFFEKCTTLK